MRGFKEGKAMTDKIVIHYSLAALKAEREHLARIQQREYQTRGNTQRCQESAEAYVPPSWKDVE